jgi:hypothetical protein
MKAHCQLSLWIILSVALYGCNGNIRTQQEESNPPYEETTTQLFTHLMFSQIESEGCLLNFNIAASDSLAFHSELKKLPKLVFFHSELNCNSCVEKNIPFLNSLGNLIGHENILFIASYKQTRDMLLFKRINDIKFHIYNASSVELPIEELNLPFCFVINSELKAESVFIPIKEDSLHFKRYLELIKHKYFDDRLLALVDCNQ